MSSKVMAALPRAPGHHHSLVSRRAPAPGGIPYHIWTRKESPMCSAAARIGSRRGAAPAMRHDLRGAEVPGVSPRPGILGGIGAEEEEGPQASACLPDSVGPCCYTSP